MINQNDQIETRDERLARLREEEIERQSRYQASLYCEHGTYIGDWAGPDYLCHYCEMGE